MGLKSGDLAGIFRKVVPIYFNVSFAAVLFWHRLLYMRIILVIVLLLDHTCASIIVCGNLRLINSAKIIPVIISCLSARTAPLLYKMATKTWTLVPPARALDQIVLHCRPSFAFQSLKPVEMCCMYEGGYLSSKKYPYALSRILFQKLYCFSCPFMVAGPFSVSHIIWYAKIHSIVSPP